jgi:N-acyl-D-amino-acid deacylase
MKALVKEAMDQGAAGFSTGLVYEPGKFGDTDEVIELVKVIAPYNGIYHTHIRNESDSFLDAVREAITITQAADVRTNISHFKVIGKPNWGLVKEACTMIEEARSQGLEITTDQYPYRFSSNSPYMRLIPSEAWRQKDQERLRMQDLIDTLDHLRDEQVLSLYKKATPFIPISENHQKFLDELPRKRLLEFAGSRIFRTSIISGPYNTRERGLFLERLKDPSQAVSIKEIIKTNIDKAAGPENFIVAVCAKKQYEGKTLSQVAAIKGKSIVDTAIELELMGAKCVPLRMCEPDIEYIMKKEYVATGSDGESLFFGIGWPHIRSYSTFLHKIKKYGLNRKTVSLSHIIRSQTSLPADIMNWEDRGWIEQGYKADIVIFDLKKIETPTSVTNPHQFSQGVVYLVINGKVVIEKGDWTGLLPGKVLAIQDQ